MAVAAVPQFDPSKFFQTSATPAAGGQRLDTKVSAISASTDLTGQLSVTTAEGDKITLSADFAARYRAVSYQAQVQTENGTVDVNAKSIEASLKKQYGVTVEGDLNEQELSDLEKLFRKVGNIFRKFFNGQDEQALAKTAKLADKFGGLSSLSSLDLSVNVERSVTIVAAQVASSVTGQPALPTDQTTQTPAATPSSGTATDTPAAEAATGAASSTAAETPQSSTGTTAPTQPSADAATPAADSAVRLVAPAPDAAQPKSLAQQVLDALDQAKVEQQKVRKYLPDFFKQLQEDLSKELRGERTHRPHHRHHHHDDDAPAQQPTQTQTAQEPAQTQTPPAGNSSAVLAYQSVRQISFSLSITT